jgi:hypothetical protein
VWFAAGGLPLASLVIAVGLRLVFHTWPDFDAFGSAVTAGYVVLVGTRQSLALRNRCRARELIDAQRHTAGGRA